ncbi:MAG: SSS family transporter [Haloarculaceae archaeon]|jgi:SSS family transporter
MTSLKIMLPFCGYLGFLSLVSYYGYTETKTEADFLVAGRTVGRFLGAGTLLASQISASTVVGAVGIHYVFGIGFAWVWAGILVGWLISLRFVAPQIREFGGMTIPDFVGSRYADDGANGDYARALSALLIVGAFMIFLTGQYTAGSLIVQELFGVSERVGIALTASIAVAYTTIGGMRASVLTDFVQAVVLVGGMAIAVPLALAEVGGLNALTTQLRATDPSLLGQALPLPQITGFVLASVFGVAVAPMIVARFYSMRDESVVKSAIHLSLGAQAVIAVAVVILGLSARVLFPDLAVPDMAAIVLSQEVFGPVLGTVFVLALLSAILSTIDSVLLVASAGIAHDFYVKLIRRDAPERRKMWVNRGAVLAVGLVPGVLTFYNELFGGLITLITLLNLSLQGAMLFVPLFFGLHWRRATTAGGIGSMVAGFATVILWYVGTELLGIVPQAIAGPVGDPVVPGVLVSLVAMVALSLVTGEPSAASTNPFFSEEEP